MDSGESMRRNTRQRRVILRAVRDLGCHPTAEQVFDRVRQELPGTSMSTVYRNLGILADQGLIKALQGTGRETHYDHNNRKHCHITCSVCGRICDVDANLLDKYMPSSEDLSGFRLQEVCINLVGICPECSEKKGKGAEE